MQMHLLIKQSVSGQLYVVTHFLFTILSYDSNNCLITCCGYIFCDYSLYYIINVLKKQNIMTVNFPFKTFKRKIIYTNRTLER